MSQDQTNFQKALGYAQLLSGVLARASTSLAIVNAIITAAHEEGRDISEKELGEIRARRKKAEAEFLSLMPPDEIPATPAPETPQA